MRRIAHLSDLHFGACDARIVEGVLVDLERQAPDLVVVSGDLTQRARIRQFKQARAMLDKIQAPLLVVPGNHDVPLYDVARRFLAPLRRYQHFITEDLAPTFLDDDLAVLGLNTARSFTWKDGTISPDQVGAIRSWAGTLGEGRFRVLATHHPFLPPEARPHERIVGGADAALRAIEEANVELLLAGHLHQGYSGDARAHHVTLGRSILVAQAGTATSTRVRGEPNTYNLVLIEEPRVVIEVRTWNGAAFEGTLRTTYARTPGGWKREVP